MELFSFFLAFLAAVNLCSGYWGVSCLRPSNADSGNRSQKFGLETRYIFQSDISKMAISQTRVGWFWRIPPPPFFSKTFFYISKWRASQIPKNLGGFMAAGRSRLCRRRRWDLHGRRSNAGAQAGFVTHLKDLKETGVFFLNFKQTKKDIFSLEFVAKNCPTFFFPWNLLQSVFIFWRFSNLGHSVFFSGSYVPTYKRVRRGAIKPEIRPLMEGSRSFCWWATPLKTNSPRKIPIELLANTIKMLDFPASYVSWCRSVTKKLKQHLLTLLTNLTADTALMVGCWISSYSTFSQCPGAIRCVWWTFDRILF